MKSKMILMLLKVLEQSNQEWDMTIYSDGTISGYIDDTQFAYSPEVNQPDSFIAELVKVVIQGNLDIEEEEEDCCRESDDYSLFPPLEEVEDDSNDLHD